MLRRMRMAVIALLWTGENRFIIPFLYWLISSRHETRWMLPVEPDVVMLLFEPLSKLTSMLPPTKIGLLGSELKPMPAAG
jgi:hypothetical protein